MHKKPMVFAHRGASYDYPENTMIAFEKAVEMGAQGFELDVQLSQDNEVVVIHDETVNRTSDQDGNVKDYTLKQLKDMDFGVGFSAYNDVRIPTLDEVMALAADANIVINVEIKNTLYPYPGLPEKVVAIAKHYGMMDRLVVSSFHHPSLVALKEMDQKVETALLYESTLYQPWQYAKACKADGIHPYYLAIDEDVVDHCHKNGIAVRPWTVDNPDTMKRLCHWGVDAIISNCPDVALKITR